MIIYLNNEALDCDNNTIIGITKQFSNIEDFTSIFTDFTKTVELPRTSKNDIIFGKYFELDRVIDDSFSSVQYFDGSNKADCRIEDNNTILLEGYAILNSTTVDKYKITIYGELGKLFKEIRDIPFDVLDNEAVLNKELVANSFKKESLSDNVEFNNSIVLNDFILNIPKDCTVEAKVQKDTPSNVVQLITSNPSSLYLAVNYGTKQILWRDFFYRPTLYALFADGVNYDNLLFTYKIGTGTDGNSSLWFNGIEYYSITDTIARFDPTDCTFTAGTYYYLRIYNSLGNVIADYQPSDNDNPLQPEKYCFKNLIDNSPFPKYLGYSNNGTVTDLLDVIGYCSIHQGLYQDFDSTKIDGEDIYMDIYNSKYDGLTEHTLKEFRSYYQQPYVFIRPLLLNLQQYINRNYNYKLIYDTNWFSADNPYWSQLIMMAKGFSEREDEHQDGPLNYFHFRENNSYLGFNSTECLGELKYTVDKANFEIIPDAGSVWQFNMPDNYTIEKPQLTNLLKTNLNFNWQFQAYDRYGTPTILKDINGLHLVTKWFIPSATDKTDPYHMYPNSNFGMKVTIKCGNIVDKIGYYGDHPLQDIVDNWLSDCNQKIQLGEDGKYDYPVNQLLESYTPETNIKYLAFPLGISHQSYLLNSNETISMEVEFYSNLPQSMFSINTKRTSQIDDWCLCGIFIPTGLIDPFHMEEQFDATFEGNVFESDYDSRRSNSTISVSKILDEEFKPIDLLIKYAKMFRLYFDVDYLNKTITVTDRYFDDYEVVDWSNKIDYKSMQVNPISNNDEAVLWGYEESDLKYAENYKLKYGVELGDFKIKTGINTLNTTKQMFEDFPISVVSQEYYPEHYANRNRLSTESCPTAIDNTNNATAANKVSLYGSFFFWNTPQNTDSYFNLREVDPKGGTYLITDDTYIQISTNEYCYSGRSNSVAVPKDKFPFVDTICMNYFGDTQKLWGCQWSEPKLKYNNKVHHSELFPYKTPFYIKDLWDKYLEETYNKNNKKITCKAALTLQDFSQFKFNKFVKIENSLFAVSKIDNFTGSGLCDVTLYQVTDPNNYKSIFRKLLG